MYLSMLYPPQRGQTAPNTDEKRLVQTYAREILRLRRQGRCARKQTWHHDVMKTRAEQKTEQARQRLGKRRRRVLHTRGGTSIPAIPSDVLLYRSSHEQAVTEAGQQRQQHQQH